MFKKLIKKIIKNHHTPNKNSEPEVITSANYWTRHNVTLHQQFNSREESLEYFHWRNRQYFLYEELMSCKGFDDQTILDYGCGPGNDLVGFVELSKPKQVIAMDVSPSSLAEAQKRLGLHQANDKIKYILLEEGQYLPLEEDSIDYIHSSGVLHHTPNMEEILADFHRILKKNGVAKIMVYNYNSLWANLYVPYLRQIEQGIDTNEPFEVAFRRSTDGYECPISRCFTDTEFNEICSKQGFESNMIGVAISTFEMSLLPKRYEALGSLNLAKKHRDFLYELTFDTSGFPLYKGQVAGIDAVFELRKK